MDVHGSLDRLCRFSVRARRYPRSIEGTDLTRIVQLTDGVFAIAMTLLVFGLDAPTGDHEFTKRVLELWPDLFAYAVSFAVVGRLWIAHHRFFETLHRVDPYVMGLNLVYLSLVALVPFTTGLLGDHGDDVITPIVYAGVLGAAASVNWLMVRHTLHREHVREEARARTEPLAARLSLVTPAVFFASIPLAFISPYLAEGAWLGLLLQRPVRQRTRARSDTTSS